MCSTTRGFILVNKVTHRRFLPATSAHAFCYPTISFFLSLSALENNELDLGRGWLFGYGGAIMRLTGIRPSAYLQNYVYKKESIKGSQTIKAKLCDVIARFGHDASKLSDAWMMTMPSYFGFEGINPLTMYYCYNNEQDLWLVVLEVHNTFKERHVYVLQVELSDKDNVPAGFTYSWTFPRQFHVSPFNDRSGFYKCSIVASSSLTAPNPPLPAVRIHLYTADNSMLKLMATLRPLSFFPLTPGNLARVLVSSPFTLLLTFLRIAYEAFRIHYIKKLNVFIRPEPRAINPGMESLFSNLSGIARNPVQSLLSVGIGATKSLGTGGGVGWQSPGPLERYAHGLTEDFLFKRAKETGISIILTSTNPLYGVKTFPSDGQDIFHSSLHLGTSRRQLSITFRSAQFFTILLTSPSAHYALLYNDAEEIFIASDRDLFLEVFSLAKGEIPIERISGALIRVVLALALDIRFLMLPHTLRLPMTSSDSSHPLDLQPSAKSRSLIWTFARPMLNVMVVIILYVLSCVEQLAFAIFRAQFVSGNEPWNAWKRAEALLKEPSVITNAQDPK